MAATACSALLGVAWNVVAVKLMQGRLADAFGFSWMAAGVIAGVSAGRLTVWSRARCGGREHLGWGVATYYAGIVAYWAAFVVIERVALVARHGGWTDFDLADHVGMIAPLLLLGTLGYGIVLVPLAFASRALVWRVHERFGG